MSRRFTPDYRHEQAAYAAYERDNAAVHDQVPPERLIEWAPGEFRGMAGLGPAAS